MRQRTQCDYYSVALCLVDSEANGQWRVWNEIGRGLFKGTTSFFPGMISAKHIKLKSERWTIIALGWFRMYVRSDTTAPISSMNSNTWYPPSEQFYPSGLSAKLSGNFTRMNFGAPSIGSLGKDSIPGSLSLRRRARDAIACHGLALRSRCGSNYVRELCGFSSLPCGQAVLVRFLVRARLLVLKPLRSDGMPFCTLRTSSTWPCLNYVAVCLKYAFFNKTTKRVSNVLIYEKETHFTRGHIRRTLETPFQSNFKEEGLGKQWYLFQHSPGAISGKHGRAKSEWSDQESNPCPPECETGELALRHLARFLSIGHGLFLPVSSSLSILPRLQSRPYTMPNFCYLLLHFCCAHGCPWAQQKAKKVSVVEEKKECISSYPHEPDPSGGGWIVTYTGAETLAENGYENCYGNGHRACVLVSPVLLPCFLTLEVPVHPTLKPYLSSYLRTFYTENSDLSSHTPIVLSVVACYKIRGSLLRVVYKQVADGKAARQWGVLRVEVMRQVASVQESALELTLNSILQHGNQLHQKILIRSLKLAVNNDNVPAGPRWRSGRNTAPPSHQGEPGSIPGGVASGFSHVGIVPNDDTGRWVFSGISRFPPSLYSGAAPHSPHLTLIGSKHLEVKSRPDLSTPPQTSAIKRGYFDVRHPSELSVMSTVLSLLNSVWSLAPRDVSCFGDSFAFRNEVLKRHSRQENITMINAGLAANVQHTQIFGKHSEKTLNYFQALFAIISFQINSNLPWQNFNTAAHNKSDAGDPQEIKTVTNPSPFTYALSVNVERKGNDCSSLHLTRNSPGKEVEDYIVYSDLPPLQRDCSRGVVVPQALLSAHAAIHNWIIDKGEVLLTRGNCAVWRTRVKVLPPSGLTTLSGENRIRLERASQKQSSDTHKTPYGRVKQCLECKKYQGVRARQHRRIHAKQTAVSPTQPKLIFNQTFEKSHYDDVIDFFLNILYMSKVKITLPPSLNPHLTILSGDSEADGCRRFREVSVVCLRTLWDSDYDGQGEIKNSLASSFIYLIRTTLFFVYKNTPAVVSKDFCSRAFLSCPRLTLNGCQPPNEALKKLIQQNQNVHYVYTLNCSATSRLGILDV
ncbi:hypothetical protein PR048_024993 [Dryococelus australis]|uniref:Uncharacterized protein n=1 Tax=Dryococelus australis TaxID=614101 RepID=A0ABQ9GQ59_9NEOP|nr:hypothetical protein PR048_024993 [Dryococelus australis]